MNEIDVLPGDVQLWWASLEVSDAEIERLHRTLDPEELRRARRFRVAAPARRFIAARAALRLILSRATGVGPAEVAFRFGEHGKPRLSDGGPSFNASDSADFVVVALASAEVGVDIELLRPLTRPDGLARRVCTDRELESLQRVPHHERDALLLRLWTCKEAALKAIGTGLRGGARNVEIEIPANGPPKLAHLLGEHDGWTLFLADLAPDLLCSVVVKGRTWRVVSRPFSLQST